MKTVYQVLEEMLGEEQAAIVCDFMGRPRKKHLRRCAALIIAMGALTVEQAEKMV